MQSQKQTKTSKIEDFFRDTEAPNTEVQAMAQKFQNEIEQQVVEGYLNFTEKKPTFFSLFTKVPALATVGLFVIGLVLLFLFNPNFRNSSSNSANLAVANKSLVVTEIDGTAGWDIGNGWEEAEVGDRIIPGALFNTTADSYAGLDSDTGSIIRLDSLSELKVVDVSESEQQISGLKGSIYSIADTKLVVTLDNVSYQGSARYLMRNLYDEQGIYVFEGSLKATDGQTESIVTSGYKFTKTDTGNSYTLEKFNLDELLSDSFVQWNFEKDADIIPVLNLEEETIIDLTNNSFTDQEQLTLTGSCDVHAKIIINGIEVTNSDGTFSIDINLIEGINEITIETIDQLGNSTEQVLFITRTLEGLNNSTGSEAESNASNNSGGNNTPTPTNSPSQPTPTPDNRYITLQANTGLLLISLDWSNNQGFDNSDEFIVMYEVTSGNPLLYPALNNLPVTGLSYNIINLLGGVTYDVRVCEKVVQGGTQSCGITSNEVTIQVPSILL
ncbi:hypothetical protein KC909_03290 [Candidatus Dojkabacteria bacterium]|uniref:Fibronectin type-III domain-containing protein n=1 Tax=Candidatus Dojkabacteria bacterium TaxID=2099670 RepID=A0A955L5P0_9BACT|nr:hypothetical protein [Candidatus Dojkabacteria bacterium]